MIEIVKTTPSAIFVRDGDMELKIEGESFERGHGSPDFVIYAQNIREWTTPNGAVTISDAERKEVVDFIVETLSKKGWNITAE